MIQHHDDQGPRMNAWRGRNGTKRAGLAALAAIVTALAVALPLVLPSRGGGGSSHSRQSMNVVQQPVQNPGPSAGSSSNAGSRAGPGTATGTIEPATSGGTSSTSHLAKLLTIITDTTGAPGAVNTLWRSEFPQLTNGQSWTDPTFHIYHNGQSACGQPADQVTNNSFYCYADDSIWIDTDWLAQMDARYGDYAPVIILLHELGHRVAHLSGYDGTRSIQKEEEADCIAGYETQYAAQAGLLQAADVQQGAATLYGLGDNGNSPWFNPGVHGTSSERQAAFMQGFSGSMNNCIEIGRDAYGPVQSIGAFKVDLVNGVQGQDQGNAVRLTFPNADATVDLSTYADGSVPGGTGDATSDEAAVEQQYAGQSQITDLGAVTSIQVTDQQGNQQDIPLSSLVDATDGDSIAAFHYTQTFQGTTYHGLWVLVERPGAGALIVDTYTTGTDDPSSYYGLALQTLSGIESPQS